MDLRVGGIRAECSLKPRQLIGIELIGGGVVESDKVNAVLDPMVVRPELEILAIVVEALFAQERSIEPIGELNQVLIACLRRDDLVVSDGEKHGQGAEGKKLILYEVVPGEVFVAGDIERFGKVC